MPTVAIVEMTRRRDIVQDWIDREPLVGEEEVDSVAVDAVVDEGARQVVALAEAEEEQLEVGARPLYRAQVRHAVAGELRLAEGAAEEVGLDRPPHILDRPRGGRHRDPVPLRHVSPGEGATAVNDDPGS